MATKINPSQLNIAKNQVIGPASFAVTSVFPAWQDTGINITLPGPGTYLLYAQIRGNVQSATVPHYIFTKFYNATDGADVADTETFVVQTQVANLISNNTAPMFAQVTVTA